VRVLPLLALLALLSLLSCKSTEPKREAWTNQVEAWAPAQDIAIQDRGLLRGHEDRKEFFPEPDPWMNAAVRDALDRPLAVAGDAERAAGFAVVSAEGPRLVWSSLSDYAGSGALGIRPWDPVAVEGLPSLHADTRAAIESIYGAAIVAESGVQRAMTALTKEEQAFLRAHLTEWFTRTEPEDEKRAKSGVEDEEGTNTLLRCAELMTKVDAAQLRNASYLLQAAVANALPGLREQKELKPNRTVIETPHGPIVLRGSNSGGGTEDALLVIDFGGDDEFKSAKEPQQRAVRIVIDLGGDDIYLSQSNFSWGSAMLGVSLLVDTGGDDDYRGGDWSLGCGLGGHGVLWDLEGNDRYMGGLCTQGVGVFGTGLLLDDGGDDDYHAGVFAQGFAGSGGVGVIVDRSGNDEYIAGRDEEDIWRRAKTWVTFAQGSAYSHRFGHIVTEEGKPRKWKMTGQVAGGVGILIDGGGNDRYHADVFGQGAAYWYSLGLLVDLGGDDVYRTTWYGQGVGTHAAVGCLVDSGGNDRYHSRNTSQGCGHDFSAGILVDRGGDDRYRSMSLSQGAGNETSGVGILIDEGGDDHYRCGNDAWGIGRPLPARAELAPYGFFIDSGGENTYEGSFAPQRTPGTWKQGERGFGYDGSGK
jgi:hypothetical protein